MTQHSPPEGMQLSDLQRKILASILRITKNPDPQLRLEELNQAAKVTSGLYRQEGNESALKVFAPVAELIRNAKSAEELERMLENLRPHR